MRASPFVRGLLVAAGLAGSLAPAVCLAAAGDLDPSFGSGGIVVTTLSASEDRAQAAVLLPDGKVVAGGGIRSAPGVFDFALVRYDTAGVPDPSFGTGGHVFTPAGGSAEIGTLLLQPDGKIVAQGSNYNGSDFDTVLVRYEADGTLDPTFGGGAPVTSTIGPGDGFPREAVLQPDGRIVVVGTASGVGGGDFALARFLSDGSVDTTFGTGGAVTLDIAGSPDSIESVALQPDGKIVVAGTSFGPGMALARYDAAGVLDPTFGSGGIVMGTLPNYPRAMLLQSDGKIVVAGDTFVGPNRDIAIVRYDADGNVDGTFGHVITPVGPLDDEGFAVLRHPAGRLTVVGDTTTSTFSANFALVRYDDFGSVDGAFGVGGIVSTPIGFFTRAQALAAVQRPDGRIVAVGSRTNFGSNDFALAQYFGNVCGDGTVEAGEDCDDGNATGGDCCSATCEFEAAGSACASDGDACTTDACDGAGACAHAPVVCALCETCDSSAGCIEAPRGGCLGIAPGGRSSLDLKDRTPDTSDVAKWKWRSGVVAVGDFGDPIATDDYALCVYQGASQALWRRLKAPAGGACHFHACWKPLLPNGAKYTDSERTPDGISSLVLRSNVPGHMQLKLKGKGSSLALPPLATLALPVRVQLQREGGACWDVTYAAARANTAARFSASAE